MWDKLKKILFNKRLEYYVDPLDEETRDLVNRLTYLLEFPNLVDLLNDRVVKIYLLSMFTRDIEELTTGQNFINNTGAELRSVSDYFNSNQFKVRTYIKILIKNLESNTVGYRIKLDINELLEMFEFYINEGDSNE